MAGGYRAGTARGTPGPLESRLSGTGRFADDLWLLAHHEVTGRPYLRGRQLGLGLAGGLLAELMTGPGPAVRLWFDGVLEVRPDVPPRAVQAHPLLRQIAGEPELLPVRDWLEFMARTAPAETAGRLEAAGYLTCPPGRRLLSRPARPVPADPDWAFAAMARVTAALRRPSGTYGTVLAALAAACGLGYRLDQYLPGAATAAHAAAAALPGELQQLITQTRTAVSATVLSRT